MIIYSQTQENCIYKSFTLMISISKIKWVRIVQVLYVIQFLSMALYQLAYPPLRNQNPLQTRGGENFKN